MKLRPGSLWQSLIPNIDEQICCIELGMVLYDFWSFPNFSRQALGRVFSDEQWPDEERQVQCTVADDLALRSEFVGEIRAWREVDNRGGGKRSGGGGFGRGQEFIGYTWWPCDVAEQLVSSWDACAMS
jgi:hypothetical protein